MSGIPTRLLRDQVTVQTYAGEGALGPVYAAAETVACRVQMLRQLVRDPNGSEVVSEMTVYLHPDDAAAFTPESLVTFGSYSTTVLGRSTHARPGEDVLTKVVCR